MTCKYPVNSRSYKTCALCSDKNICEDSTIVDNSTYLLSAIDAYHKTKDNLKICYTKELIEISKKISDAVVDGKFEISSDGHLQPETKQRLAELGYKISIGSQYNEAHWTISWK